MFPFLHSQLLEKVSGPTKTPPPHVESTLQPSASPVQRTQVLIMPQGTLQTPEDMRQHLPSQATQAKSQIAVKPGDKDKDTMPKSSLESIEGGGTFIKAVQEENLKGMVGVMSGMKDSEIDICAKYLSTLSSSKMIGLIDLTAKSGDEQLHSLPGFLLVSVLEYTDETYIKDVLAKADVVNEDVF